MSRASNTLRASDISTTPIKVKYAFSASNNTAINYDFYGIKANPGINDPAFPDYLNNYNVIKQLYYKNYLTGSLLQSASYWNSNQQSTACSGSFEYENRYFPDNLGASVLCISIPPIIYGEQISRNSVSITNMNVAQKYTDDGNGNLIDSSGNHIGNVIYSQGCIIITSQDTSLIGDPPDALDIQPISFLAETTIYQNEYRCHLNENDFNYTQNLSARYLHGDPNKSVAYIKITNLDGNADIITVSVNDPIYGTISLGSYSQGPNDTSISVLTNNIANVLSLNQYGYSVIVENNRIKITSPSGTGTAMSGATLMVSLGKQSSVFDSTFDITFN